MYENLSDHLAQSLSVSNFPVFQYSSEQPVTFKINLIRNAPVPKRSCFSVVSRKNTASEFVGKFE